MNISAAAFYELCDELDRRGRVYHLDRRGDRVWAFVVDDARCGELVVNFDRDVSIDLEILFPE